MDITVTKQRIATGLFALVLFATQARGEVSASQDKAVEEPKHRFTTEVLGRRYQYLCGYYGY